jgi:luciferase family oxidoreductase group 1
VALPLSILDLSPVTSGTAPTQAIRDSVALARRADELSFVRYWFAEHHGMPSIASSAPEVLIAHVAAVTTRIRVGAGGIMIPNHAPLHVVEVFRTLAALHPDRIDLGLGRAPGTDPVTASALRRGARQDPNELLGELIAFDEADFPDGHPFAAIAPMPSGVTLPDLWMLGSTDEGARIGAALGMRYAFAGHFAMKNARLAMHLYRERFQPSARLATPWAMLAVSVVCGEDDAHAERLAAPARLAIVRHATGRPAPLATVEVSLVGFFGHPTGRKVHEVFSDEEEARR